MTDSMFSSRSRSARSAKKPLPHGWIVVPSKSFPDRVYYYNTISKCSTWNNPCTDHLTGDYEFRTPNRQRSINTQTNPSSSNIQAKSGSISSRSNRSLDDDESSMLIDEDIEDYDEDHNDYFDNVPMNNFSLRSNNFTSPPISTSPSNSPDELFPKLISPVSSVVATEEPKELWTVLLKSPEKVPKKRSAVLNDLSGPAEKIKKPVYSKVLAELCKPDEVTKPTEKKSPPAKNNPTPRKDTLRFSKSDKNDPKFKKSESALAKRIPKVSKVLGSHLDEIKNSSPLSDIYKLSSTPAQSRLLKVREREIEMAQKNVKTRNKSNRSRSSGNVQQRMEKIREEQGKKTDDLRINPVFLKNTNIGQGRERKKIQFVGETTTEFVESDPVIFTNVKEEPEPEEEEMEWEPCDEEELIEHINSIRKTLSKEQELLSHIVMKDQPMGNHKTTESLSWIIVVDTNILLSSLNFIKDLRDIKINDTSYPIIYIPWRVLQELDHLKDSPQLKVAARRAISYINDNFISSHPRFQGQSFQEFSSMPKSESESSDDDILQTCLHLQKTVQDKKLILLTNDKNLESKAILSNLKSYSKERFLKEISFSKDKFVNPVYGRPGTSADAASTVVNNDTMLCELKRILKEVLIFVVETELKLAYGDDWKKMVKDRSWTLTDLIDCFLKYWRSVFHFVFPKQTFERMESLKKAFKNENLGQEDEVKSTVIVSQELLVYFKRSKEIRPYMPVVDMNLKNLNLLLNPRRSHTESPNLPQPEPNHLDSVVKTETVNNYNTGPCDKQLSVEKIRNIFRDIWNFVKEFCCALSNCRQNPDDSTLIEIKSKLPGVCNFLHELIVAIEKVTSLNLIDINENNPAVKSLTEILVKFGTNINSSFSNVYLTGDNLDQCVSLFCGDPAEKPLLETSITDFKEFLNELISGFETLRNVQ